MERRFDIAALLLGGLGLICVPLIPILLFPIDFKAPLSLHLLKLLGLTVLAVAPSAAAILLGSFAFGNKKKVGSKGSAVTGIVLANIGVVLSLVVAVLLLLGIVALYYFNTDVLPFLESLEGR